MDTLVTTEWLSQHLDAPDFVLFDCTVCTIQEDDGGFHNVSGRPDYDVGHIPNAGSLISRVISPITPAQSSLLCRRLSSSVPRWGHWVWVISLVWYFTIRIIRHELPASGGCCVGSASTGRQFSTGGLAPGRQKVGPCLSSPLPGR